MNIQFSRGDLERFAAASQDRNPLHLSSAYTRRSAFGEQVVFGILGLLAAMDPEAAPELARCRVDRIMVSFQRPLFMDVPYRVSTLRKGEGRLHLSIDEAGTILLEAAMDVSPRPTSAWPKAWTAPAHATSTAASREAQDIREGLVVSGSYAPSGEAFDELVAHYNLERGPLSAAQVSILMWTSYLVGMELPGERAIFARLDVTFKSESTGVGPGFDYEARVVKFDKRFDLLNIEAALSRQGTMIASAKLSSFVRRDTPPLDLQLLRANLPQSRALSGKVALVVGGSRGLGAATAASLVSQGCAVLATHRGGSAEIEALKKLLHDEPGSLDGVVMDAADPDACRLLSQRIAAQFGRLDLLFSNAAPHLKACGFQLQNLAGFRAFVDQSLAVTATPLAACLELLRAGTGAAALISSSVASPLAADVPHDWHHYLAAKGAAEGLFRAIALQTPEVRFLIVRPTRLLTDQTNTPQGRNATMPVEQAAAAIVARVLAKEVAHLSVLESF